MILLSGQFMSAKYSPTHSKTLSSVRSSVTALIGRGWLGAFTFQVLIQENEHGGVSLDLVFLFHEPVTFIGENDVFDRYAVLFRGRDDLIGFYLQNTRVVGTLEHHQRCLDAIGVEEG